MAWTKLPPAGRIRVWSQLVPGEPDVWFWHVDCPKHGRVVQYVSGSAALVWLWQHMSTCDYRPVPFPVLTAATMNLFLTRTHTDTTATFDPSTERC